MAYTNPVYENYNQYPDEPPPVPPRDDISFQHNPTTNVELIFPIDLQKSPDEEAVAPQVYINHNSL